ncbi:hypothetical protein [Flectobacillus major]|uniref:hypothetical protein n=1 Tax=Flectobacillus major TaxID=103 RepID=UPI000429B818|nr:hypothetical protein [Flectobacillus major]
MKTFVKTFALLSVVSFATLANNDTNTPTKTKSFEVGMYQSKNTNKMNVLIEKVVGKKVTILVKTEKGEILSTETVAKGTDSYHGKFDLDALKDGKYIFEITDGTEKVIKNINLETPKSVEVSREISIN